MRQQRLTGGLFAIAGAWLPVLLAHALGVATQACTAAATSIRTLLVLLLMRADAGPH